MRPASAGCARSQQRRSRLQVQVSNRGLCRSTDPEDADVQMQSFLDHGTVPVLSFKGSREKVEASLVRPAQAVRVELMGIATAILDRVVGEWGCLEDLVKETRGESIDRDQAEAFIEEYLRHHNVPGKLQICWAKGLSSGGKLQEYGRRDEPTLRKLRLWINSGFAGVSFSRSLMAFADHEICTHAVRAINDHSQVWVNHRGRYGLTSGGRERLTTEEGLATLNSLLCYPSQTRHLWSAAILYYCAVKGQEMGFGELHKHLIKYVRCPAKRYWYCIRTKGKIADIDEPGSCGKGQVYLEGAVDILREVDGINFHILYSGRVPLSKLGRVKRIVRPSLVTLPKFVQDQKKYKAVLKQIGRLNGILPETLHMGVVPKKGERQANGFLPDTRDLVVGRKSTLRRVCSVDLPYGKLQSSPKTAATSPVVVVPCPDGMSSSAPNVKGGAANITKHSGLRADESSCCDAPPAIPCSDGVSKSTPNDTGRTKSGGTANSAECFGVGADESSCCIVEAEGHDGGLTDDRNLEALHVRVGHGLDGSAVTKSAPTSISILVPNRLQAFPPL